MLVPFWIGLFASVLGVYAFTALRDRKKRMFLPPGPPRWPIIGNLRDLPRPDEPAWLYWLRYKDIYGRKVLVHMVPY